MMKKAFLIATCGALLCASCVTVGKYDLMVKQNSDLTKEIRTTQSELNDLKEEHVELQRQNQSLNTAVVDLTDLKLRHMDSILTLQRQMANMKLGYDTVIENYMQRITGQKQDLVKANNLLQVRTSELNEQEAAFKLKEATFLANEEAFKAKEAQLRAKQAEMEQRQSELEKQEATARQALEAKEKELEQLRSSVNNALVGFANKGMNVETRDGKVYVSMDSKLMFASASWTVSKEGVDAIKTLAKVLEQNEDLNIMVEGHTDNAAYKGSSAVKDNWDLSVMRATSIVKLLLQYGPGINPSRIEACGHGEYAPKAPNDTPANKALNRRTEIILTPKLTDILNLIEK